MTRVQTAAAGTSCMENRMAGPSVTRPQQDRGKTRPLLTFPRPGRMFYRGMSERSDRTPGRRGGVAGENDKDVCEGAPGAGGAPPPTGPLGFSGESVRFLEELPARRLDPDWHEHNRGRYERHVRRPTQSLLEGVRERYVEPLSPEVARGRRQLA